MTHLRKMMLEELERRNYAQTTIDCYIQTIEDFARHFHGPPDQLTPEHIREYPAARGSAVLLHADDQETWSVADTPYPMKARPRPSILSPEEVAHLIDSS